MTQLHMLYFIAWAVCGEVWEGVEADVSKHGGIEGSLQKVRVCRRSGEGSVFCQFGASVLNGRPHAGCAWFFQVQVKGQMLKSSQNPIGYLYSVLIQLTISVTEKAK